jgi:hypothetical protein
MGDIRITPLGQIVIVLGALGAVAAAVSAQLPEIRRYLKIRSMD